MTDRSSILARAVACAALVLSMTAQGLAADVKLWYRTPATRWMTEGLPMGNGRLGGMVFGGIGRERVQFNESSLWSGGPGEDPNYAGGNLPGGAEHLKEIRQLLADGKTREVGGLMKQYMFGTMTGFGSYQAFGDLLIDLPGQPTDVTQVGDYRRELDIARGVEHVQYTFEGVTYDREYFVSFPDQVLVVRLTTSRPGTLGLVARVTSPHAGAATVGKDDTLTVGGKVAGNGLGFEAVARVRAEGGTTAVTRVRAATAAAAATPATAGAPAAASAGDGMVDAVEVKGADAVTIVLAGATGYLPAYPAYRGNDFRAANRRTMAGVAGKSYADLLSAHAGEFGERMGRVQLDLGKTDPAVAALPTDERLVGLRNSLRAPDPATTRPGAAIDAIFLGPSADPELEALFFQFGRYLLLSCSRPGGLPSNLQGLWCDSLKPTWQSDYHVNINLQMMYWPAEVTNLSDCAEPLIAFVDNLRAPGRVTAKTYYGAPGWVVHYTTNLWGFTAPGTSTTYGNFPAAAAWLCQPLWEHYQFTGDREFLAKRAYPVMKEAAEFWFHHLTEDTDGTLVSSPSASPEHGGVAVGCAMDQQIVWDLFTNCIRAGEALGTDADFRERLKAMRDKLSPPKVGRYGQLQEWKADLDDPTDTHRHVSHLFALHPGRQITPLTTPGLAAAAKKSLEFRGDVSTGWSMAWKINFWARLLDGDHAYKLLHDQLTPVGGVGTDYAKGGGTYPNLLDAHPPFQIDGNFGATAGIAEMLLQSHAGEIHLLPALPKAWPGGSARGLRARGGFEVDLAWREGKLLDATLRSAAGGECAVRSGDVVRQVKLGRGGTYKWSSQ